jgi:pyruvate dehydrogenase E2 component (dihydrolipoamide acetyltransferase)
MAKTEVVMPQMGESITTGTITKWHKNVGDIIKLDETLLDISTDKVESEIPSPVEGKIVALLYTEGTTVDVGKVIAHIDDDLNAKAESAPSNKVETSTVSAVTPKENTSAVMGSDDSDRKFFTPLVRKMAQEAGISLSELENLKGSGSAGRVNKQDLEDYISSKKTQATPAAAATQPVIAQNKVSAPSASVPKTFTSGRVEIIQMDNMRKTIAKNMLESKRNVPHVNSISEVDLTHLVKFRESFKNEFERQEGFKLTYTPFIIRALVMALRDYPLVNSSVDGDQIIVKKDINMGVAVAVPGNGLIVPVIKAADTLNMVGLCRVLNDLANRARAKKLTLDDLSNGTFTYTNVGSFGTIMATPIILAPQVGIYASGVIQKRAVVTKDDSIAIRSMMYGTHTYDHRIVDGELGGKFLEGVHKHLSEMNPKDLF